MKLNLKKKPIIPLEADVITTDNFLNKSLDEIKAMNLFIGNEIAKLEEYFDIDGINEKRGNIDNIQIIINGDLSNVKRIGEKMSGGEIIINGDIGMHVGNQMSGGKITVNGNADDWAGAMLSGGELEINGNARNYVGAAYRGFWKGMTDGVIRVKGKIGNEAMLWSRNSKGANKWPILYCGGAGSFLGIHNHGGTIIVDGDVDRYAGADQAWGTIIIKGKLLKKLPSYKKIGEVNEIKLANGDIIQGKFIEYSGDHTIKKETNGRLYIVA